MAKLSGPPTAQRLSQSSAQTVWLIKFPSTSKVVGKAYRATTYPDSSLLHIESAARGRAVATGPAKLLSVAIRDAIQGASQ